MYFGTNSQKEKVQRTLDDFLVLSIVLLTYYITLHGVIMFCTLYALNLYEHLK